MAENNSNNLSNKAQELLEKTKKLLDNVSATIKLVTECEKAAHIREHGEEPQPQPEKVVVKEKDGVGAKTAANAKKGTSQKNGSHTPRKEGAAPRRDGGAVDGENAKRDRRQDAGRSRRPQSDEYDKDRKLGDTTRNTGARSESRQKRDSGFAAPSIQQNTGRDRNRVDKPNPSRYEDKNQAARNSRVKKNNDMKGSWNDGTDDDTPAMGNRRKVQKKKVQQPVVKAEPVKIDKAVMTSELITVKDLSEKIGKTVAEIVKKLFMLGIMATINQEIDYDTASLVCSDFGIELELQVAKSFEEVLTEQADDADDESELVPRPPVITIMGHVDHGKTSLLDAIRHSNVTEGEAGGITQHIGAYQVTCNGRLITFIDTPGHEAFTSMRARGAQVTDIVILVVAADDGIMPQTIEAINHSKAAGVPIIVAVNKIDKDGANPDRIKMQLTEHDLVVEDYGGDVICVPVSAKKKQNIDGLLEMVLLQADILELRANPNRLAKGTIIEAELHKGKGPVATVLVQNGSLKIGDPIVAGTAYGKVRAMMDDKGRRVTKAGPGTPVQVLGFNEVPSGGDILNVAEMDKLSRQVAEERRDKMKAEQIKSMSKVSLNDLFSQIAEGNVKELNIIIKADVQGSVEAVKQALEKLSTPEVRVKCIHGGVGAVTSNDIMFAAASNAIVIGFNVRPDSAARAAAEKENVDMRLYRIIYQAIEDVQKAMLGMFDPEYKEVELGRIVVRDTFKVSGVGTIAGAYVQEGKVSRNAQVRVVRDGIVIHEGKIASLKRFKDDAKEVAAGYECGIGIEGFNDIQEGDVIEAFEMEEIKRV